MDQYKNKQEKRSKRNAVKQSEIASTLPTDSSLSVDLDVLSRAKSLVKDLVSWTSPKQEKLRNSLSSTAYKTFEYPVVALLNDLQENKCLLTHEDMENISNVLSNKSKRVVKASNKTAESDPKASTAPAKSAPSSTQKTADSNSMASTAPAKSAPSSTQKSSETLKTADSNSLASTAPAKSVPSSTQKTAVSNSLASTAPAKSAPSSTQKSSETLKTAVSNSLASTATAKGSTQQTSSHDTLSGVPSLPPDLNNSRFLTTSVKAVDIIVKESDYLGQLMKQAVNFINKRQYLYNLVNELGFYNNAPSKFLFQQSIRELILSGEAALNFAENVKEEVDATSLIKFQKLFESEYESTFVNLSKLNKSLENLFLSSTLVYHTVPEVVFGRAPVQIDIADRLMLRSNEALLLKFESYNGILQKLLNGVTHVNKRREILLRKLLKLAPVLVSSSNFRKRCYDLAMENLDKIILVEGETIEVSRMVEEQDEVEWEKDFVEIKEEISLLV
uniref:Uncharacterized protein n=1 Tax=Panagrolaimus sp. ES5 TaxID=591445 RepID=A0AC34GZN6_9BILA